MVKLENLLLGVMVRWNNMLNFFNKIWSFVVICFSFKIYFPVLIISFCAGIFGFLFVPLKQRIKNEMIKIAIEKNGLNSLISVTEKINDQNFGSTILLDEYRWEELQHPIKWSNIDIKKMLYTPEINSKGKTNPITPVISFLITLCLSSLWPLSIPFLVIFVIGVVLFLMTGIVWNKLFEK